MSSRRDTPCRRVALEHVERRFPAFAARGREPGAFPRAVGSLPPVTAPSASTASPAGVTTVMGCGASRYEGRPGDRRAGQTAGRPVGRIALRPSSLPIVRMTSSMSLLRALVVCLAVEAHYSGTPCSLTPSSLRAEPEANAPREPVRAGEVDRMRASGTHRHPAACWRRRARTPSRDTANTPRRIPPN